MTLVEILCNRTRICRPADATQSRSEAPLFILEILFGVHYSVMRPALARASPSISSFSVATERDVNLVLVNRSECRGTTLG